MYKIFKTSEFEKKFDQLDSNLQRQIEKEISQLETNPYLGKHLGYKLFREKKIRGYRIYYLIYEEMLLYLL